MMVYKVSNANQDLFTSHSNVFMLGQDIYAQGVPGLEHHVTVLGYLGLILSIVKKGRA